MKVPVRAFIRGNFWAGPAFARIPLLKRIAAIDFYSASGHLSRSADRFFTLGDSSFCENRENIPRCKSTETSSSYTNSTCGRFFKLGQQRAIQSIRVSRVSSPPSPPPFHLSENQGTASRTDAASPLYLSSDPTQFISSFHEKRWEGRQRPRRLRSLALIVVSPNKLSLKSPLSLSTSAAPLISLISLITLQKYPAPKSSWAGC